MPTKKELPPRPDLSKVKNLPKGTVYLQAKGFHWYVVKRKYTPVFDEVTQKKSYKEQRVYLGQVVDNEFLSQDEYKARYTRHGHRRAASLPTQLPSKPAASEGRIHDYRLGAAALVYAAAESVGLKEDLLAAGFPENTVDCILSLTAFCISRNSNSFYLYKDWACNRLLPLMSPMDGKALSLFFECLGGMQDELNALFKRRIARLQNDEFLSLDSTNIACESEESSYVVEGKNKDGSIRNQVALVAVVGQTSRAPVMYKLMAGNVFDAETVEDMLKRLKTFGNIKRAVTDKGYFSTKNFITAKKLNFNLICSVKLSMTFVLDEINAIQEKLVHSFEHHIPGSNGVSGLTKKIVLTDADGTPYEFWLHMFCDSYRRTITVNKFFKALDEFEASWKAKSKTAPKDPLLKFYQRAKGSENIKEFYPIERNMIKINTELRYAGFFANLTTFEQENTDNYFTYVARDCIEKNFRFYKSEAGAGAVRAHTDPVIEGRAVISFCSAIVLNHLNVLLDKPLSKPQSNGKINYSKPVRAQFSLPQLIEKMDPLSATEYADGTFELSPTITKKLENAFAQMELPDLKTVTASYTHRKI